MQLLLNFYAVFNISKCLLYYHYYYSLHLLDCITSFIWKIYINIFCLLQLICHIDHWLTRCWRKQEKKIALEKKSLFIVVIVEDNKSFSDLKEYLFRRKQDYEFVNFDYFLFVRFFSCIYYNQIFLGKKSENKIKWHKRHMRNIRNLIVLKIVIMDFVLEWGDGISSGVFC